MKAFFIPKKNVKSVVNLHLAILSKEIIKLYLFVYQDSFKIIQDVIKIMPDFKF